MFLSLPKTIDQNCALNQPSISANLCRLFLLFRKPHDEIWIGFQQMQLQSDIAQRSKIPVSFVLATCFVYFTYVIISQSHCRRLGKRCKTLVPRTPIKVVFTFFPNAALLHFSWNLLFSFTFTPSSLMTVILIVSCFTLTWATWTALCELR